MTAAHARTAAVLTVLYILLALIVDEADTPLLVVASLFYLGALAILVVPEFVRGWWHGKR